MDYISTRGKDGPLGFEQTLLSGLARDGGLYLPVEWPTFSPDEIAGMRDLSYVQLAGRVMAPFCDGEIDESELAAMAGAAYAGFDHPATAPLVQLNDTIHVLELFHGPTIAFKDYAMQFLARVFDRVLSNKSQHAVILGATSGDTGSAALEAFQGRGAIDVFVLFPDGRVSPVQQRQMTSVMADGLHAVSVKGDFDDCQALVKALFNDLEFRDDVNLSAVNSINWARLMPQIVYYFSSALALGAPDRKVAFSVPTGNFGNVFAGYAAAQMGLPIERLIVASNQNDILRDFLRPVRWLAKLLCHRLALQWIFKFQAILNGFCSSYWSAMAERQRRLWTSLQPVVNLPLMSRQWHGRKACFLRIDLMILARLLKSHRPQKMVAFLLDPHSAVGLSAARRARLDGTIASDIPIVSLACAHPAKFETAVKVATGTAPALPPHMADLMNRPEQMQTIAADVDAVKALVLAQKRSA